MILFSQPLSWEMSASAELVFESSFFCKENILCGVFGLTSLRINNYKKKLEKKFGFNFKHDFWTWIVSIRRFFFHYQNTENFQTRRKDILK